MSPERPPEPPYELLGESLEFWHRAACGDAFGDNADEDVAVPCSRYGRTSGEVAWYAVGALIAFDEAAGIENTAEAVILIDEIMGLAVNDSPDVALVIHEAWDAMPAQLQECYGSIHHLRELIR